MTDEYDARVFLETFSAPMAKADFSALVTGASLVALADGSFTIPHPPGTRVVITVYPDPKA